MTARSTQAGRHCPRRTPWLLSQGLDAAGLVAPPPAMQAGAAGPQREGCGDAVLQGGTDAADAEAQAREVLGLAWSWRSPASRGQEEEPGSFLVRVPERTPVRVGACHAATLGTPAVSCLRSTGNDSYQG